MSWELRNAVGAHASALLGAKTIGGSEFIGSVEFFPPEALATKAPTITADMKIMPSKTMEMEDRFI
jgi:hypothetical protein